MLQKKGNTAEVYKEPDPQDDRRGGPIVTQGRGGLEKRGAFSQMVRVALVIVAMVQRGGPALPPGGPRIPGATGAPTGGGEKVDPLLIWVLHIKTIKC